MDDWKILTPTGETLDKTRDWETIVTTHRADPGTYLWRIFGSEDKFKYPVLLWGVLPNCELVPITRSGVWDGAPCYWDLLIEHPCGIWENYDGTWQSGEQAIADVLETVRNFSA